MMKIDERNETWKDLVEAFNAMVPEHRRAFVEVMTWLMTTPVTPPPSKDELAELIAAVRARNALQVFGALN